MINRLASNLFLSLSLLFFTVAYAEQQGTNEIALEPIELEPVTVEDRAIPSSLTQPLPIGQIETLRSTPGGTNFIDESQFKSGRTSTIVDVLQNQPGIVVGSRGNNDDAKIIIRGSNVDRNFGMRGIRVLQDGIPMNYADGSADFQWLEPFAVQNVEVYRGGNALQYGSSTLGGAINFITPTGYTASGIQSRMETGSNGYIKGQISSGMVLGKLDYYASGAASYQNGYQAHSRTRGQRYNANIGYRFNKNLETRFYGGFIQNKMQLASFLTGGELAHNPRKAAPEALDFDQQRNLIRAYVANKTTWRLNEHQQLQFGAYESHLSLDHPLFWNPFFLNGLGVLDQKSNTWGGSLSYINSHTLFGQKNRFILGMNPQFGLTNEKRFQNLSGNGRGSMVANGAMFATTLDLYAENQHHLWEKLEVVTGLNANYAIRNYHDRFHGNPNGSQTHNQDYWGINPKAGLVYNLNPTSQIYANFTRSFEPPTQEFISLGGIKGNLLTLGLKAQSSNTIEFGTRGAYKRLSWDATFYRSKIRNELLSLNDALGNPLGLVNANRTMHQGVEAGASVLLAEGLLFKEGRWDNHIALSSVGPGLMPSESKIGKDRLLFRQVYDWNHLHFVNDPVYGNNRLPGIPPHLYRAELIYEHPSGFYIQPNLVWSLSKYAVDYANTLNANPYAIFGLRTGYRSNRGWTAFVEFRNLTNKHYASAVQVIADARGSGPVRVFQPGLGFSVYGGVEFKR